MLSVQTARCCGVTLVYFDCVDEDNMISLPKGEWVLLEFVRPQPLISMGTLKALKRLAVFKGEDEAYLTSNVFRVLMSKLHPLELVFPAEYSEFYVQGLTLVRTAVLPDILARYGSSAREWWGRVLEDCKATACTTDGASTGFTIAKFNSLQAAPALDVTVSVSGGWGGPDSVDPLVHVQNLLRSDTCCCVHVGRRRRRRR